MQPDSKQSQADRTAAEPSVWKTLHRQADDGASTFSELSVRNIHNRWHALPQNNLK